MCRISADFIEQNIDPLYLFHFAVPSDTHLPTPCTAYVLIFSAYRRIDG